MKQRKSTAQSRRSSTRAARKRMLVCVSGFIISHVSAERHCSYFSRCKYFISHASLLQKCCTRKVRAFMAPLLAPPPMRSATVLFVLQSFSYSNSLHIAHNSSQLAELLDTERNYVRVLHTIADSFQSSLSSNSKIITKVLVVISFN